MTTGLQEPTELAHPPQGREVTPIRIGLLGFGRIGAALADLVNRNPVIEGMQIGISGALARSARDPGRTHRFAVTADPAILLASAPTVIVEALGGLEPARTLILGALARRIPVVTANKAVVAAYGDELFAAAERFATPLRCEAAVLAGVPFLGTFAARPLAAVAAGITGVLNGTTNFILSRMEAGASAAGALVEAQRNGFAEPDAAADLDGSDAAAKLAILIRHFGRLSIDPADVPRASTAGLEPADLSRARELGGRVKPVAFARWKGRTVTCYCGPAFVHAGDPLAALGGVLNGIRLERLGRDALHITGPGAGPAVTAATILDDVLEAAGDRRIPRLGALPRADVKALEPCGWYVSLSGRALPDPSDLADLLGAYGIWASRWGAVHERDGAAVLSLLTLPCHGCELRAGLQVLAEAADCSARAIPIVEAPHA